MRAVVTGGAGFIGANLCRRLLATDGIADVTVLDDFSTGVRSNLDGLPVRLIEGSILDTAALDEAFAGADAIIHLAALGSVPRSVDSPLPTHHANVTGTVLVLDAARRHGGVHTILAGSSSVYGAGSALPDHEDLATRPMSPYAASKVAAEAYTLAWCHSYDLPVMPLRLFNVYGPLQRPRHVYASAVPAFVDAALAGAPVTIHGDGTQSRDFTYVGSVTAVLADAVTRRVTSREPVNLAFGTRLSLLDVLAEIERQLGRPVERRRGAPRVGDMAHTQADTARMRELFPGSSPIAFADGLRATIEWMRAVSASGDGVPSVPAR